MFNPAAFMNLYSVEGYPFASLIISRDDLIIRSINSKAASIFKHTISEGTTVTTLISQELIFKLITSPSLDDSITINSPVSDCNLIRVFKIPLQDQNLVCLVFEPLQPQINLYNPDSETLALISRRTDNMVIVTDAERRITWVNDTFEKITQYKLEEVLGKKPGKVLQGKQTDPVVVKEVREKLNKGEACSADILNYKKDGTPYWISTEILPLTEAGKLIGFISIEKDITTIRRQEEIQKQLNERILLATESVGLAIWEWDIINDVHSWDEKMYSLFGLEKDVKPDWNIKYNLVFDKAEIAEMEAMLEEALKGKGDYKKTFEILLPDGSRRFISCVAVVRFDGEGRAVKMVGTARDVTRQVNAYKQLEKSETTYRSLVEDQPQIICRYDREGRLTFVNNAYVKIFGVPREELIGRRWVEFVTENNKAHMIQYIDDVFNKRIPPKNFEQFAKIADGGYVWQEWSDFPIFDKEGKIIEMQAIGQDITERKQSELLREKLENSLNESLKEKSLLLREVHHRIKNNLQLISSLLYFKSKSPTTEDIMVFLEETRQKIQSIAFVHEKLMYEPAQDEVNIKLYLEEVINKIYIASFRSDSTIKIDLNIQSFFLPTDKAIYCSMLVNELMINAVKHGFAENEGVLQVILIKEDDQCILEVSNTGGKLDANIRRGFGSELIDIFVRQLKGSHQLYNSEDNLTTHKIIFASASKAMKELIPQP